MNKLIAEIYKRTFIYRRYKDRISKTGLSFEEYCTFIYGSDDGKKIEKQTTNLFGKQIIQTNRYWYTQCVLELFNDEVYKFESNNPSPIIIDCGTNIGLSVIYFKRLFPSSVIIGFEADPKIFEICKTNLKIFGYEDVELINAAVWKEDGELNFSSDSALGGKIAEHTSAQNQVRVKALSLIPFLNKKIDFLKIDIEGAEVEVLISCANNLGNVDKLFVEYHSRADSPQELSSLLAIISQAGFRYYIREAWNNNRFPFIKNKFSASEFDLQLNIFCYR